MFQIALTDVNLYNRNYLVEVFQEKTYAHKLCIKGVTIHMFSQIYSLESLFTPYIVIYDFHLYLLITR